MKAYNQLFFLLNNVIDFNAHATSLKISKIIVFINNISKNHTAVTCLQTMFLTLNQKSSESAYSNHEDIYSVKDVVQKFNSHVSQRDQKICFAEFIKSNFKI